MTERSKDAVRESVREQYGRVAKEGSGCGCGTGCCAPTALASLTVGYSPDELGAAPEGANLGLGCGNPQAIASLRAGEVVLDLGSGGGFDCFLAAKQVGPTGHVIGVDMTPEMVSRARENARKSGASNVEFRLGEIEHLPVADASVDILISNCVINLSPDKQAVFRDAFRVLRPGGRVAFSDVVATAPLPRELAERLDAYTSCVGGAAQIADLLDWLADAGFTEIAIRPDEASRATIREWVPGSGAERYVASASITAVKPGGVTPAGPTRS